jgi:hypothetical protein
MRAALIDCRTEQNKMTKRQRQSWQAGDYFAIQLADSTCGLGQVLADVPGVLNCAICAFYAVAVECQTAVAPAVIAERELIAVQFVTPDLLHSGVWRVIGNRPFPDPERYLPIGKLRRAGYVGAVVEGSGIMIDFMNAYHGLYPWNGYHDPKYFDNLLVAPDRKPMNVMLKER